MAVPVKVNYISGDSVSINNGFLHLLAEKAEEEMKKTGGFLRLVDRKDGGIHYYNKKIGSILGDISNVIFSEISSFVKGEEADRLSLEDLIDRCVTEKRQKSKKLETALMDIKEYEAVFGNEHFKNIAKKENWWSGWQKQSIFKDDPLVIKSDVDGKKKLFIILICRCNEKWDLDPDTKLINLIDKFLSIGLMPDIEENVKNSEIKEWMTENYSDEACPKSRLIIKNRPEEIKEIRNEFLKYDFRRAHLPEYDDTIFQLGKGHWGLWKFAGLEEHDLKEQRELRWYNISREEMYARNPLDDVASDAEVVAIDFGTRSTTVAVFDSKGNFSLLPVGLRSKSIVKEEDYENPTILKFQDIEKFSADYQASNSSPDTDFNDIPASYAAQEDFNKFDNMSSKNMLQYMDQIKQWANDPRRRLYIYDSRSGKKDLFSYDQLCTDIGVFSDGVLDPIEIYAYYIGLSINNMHSGKIYLKYLLSYSATYLEKNCVQIRKSFERGLKKSLPKEIYDDKDAMKRFEVKLWRDEATAYVICALNRYMEEAANDQQKEGMPSFQDYKQNIENGGLFFGVYDFGGGTLDFSFGLLKNDEDGEKDIFEIMDRGGASNLGCENILEELAFRIYDSGREDMILKNIKCNKPPQIEKLAHEEIVGDSNEARFNTCSMAHAMRKLWINPGPDSDEGIIYVLNESGKSYTVGLADENRDDNENSLTVGYSKNIVEKFFKEKVEEGVGEFFRKYDEVVEKNGIKNKKCFIFLAGNASKADRVKSVFKAYIEKKYKNDSDKFELLPCLPTDRDKELDEKNEGGNMPTAKSGVVYGLLLSRPGVGDVIVKEAKMRKFLYHIGYRKKNDIYGKNGEFVLSVTANELSEKSKDELSENSEFKFIRKIPQEIFGLRYTQDSRYAVRGGKPLECKGPYVVGIEVPTKYVHKYLYGRISGDSDHIIELGIADTENSLQGDIKVYARCHLIPGKEKVDIFDQGENVVEKKVGNQYFFTILEQDEASSPWVDLQAIIDKGETDNEHLIKTIKKNVFTIEYTQDRATLLGGSEKKMGMSRMEIKLGQAEVNREKSLNVYCMMPYRERADFVALLFRYSDENEYRYELDVDFSADKWKLHELN